MAKAKKLISRTQRIGLYGLKANKVIPQRSNLQNNYLSIRTNSCCILNYFLFYYDYIPSREIWSCLFLGKENARANSVQKPIGFCTAHVFCFVVIIFKNFLKDVSFEYSKQTQTNA